MTRWLALLAVSAACKSNEAELPPLAPTPAAPPSATTPVHAREVIADCVYEWAAPEPLHRTDVHNGPDGAVTFRGNSQQLVLFPPGPPESAGHLTTNLKWRLPSTSDPSVELFVGRNGFGVPVCNGQERSGDDRCAFALEGAHSVEGDALALCQSMRISRAAARPRGP